jgi:hypothetical protein
MALSKIFTVGHVVNTVLLWLREEMQDDLEPNLVKNFANMAVMEEAEKISVSNTSDYGKITSLTDAAVNVSTTLVTGTSTYTNSTKTVFSVGHGLVAADVGKRVILRTSTRLGISEISEIPTINTFVLNKAFGVDVGAGLLTYTVLSHHASSNIDISGLKIMNITKLYSSTHKEVKKLGDIEADNIERNDFKGFKVYWYQHGEYIILVVPAGQVIGDLTLYYNSYPEEKTLDTEYFDIRDNYIPQVIKRTKQYCLEHLGMTPPEALTPVTEQMSEKNKNTVIERRSAIENENKNGIDG